MMQVSESELKKIKQIEFEILNAFLKCCEELHLKAFLVGGSALGAVRHQGFIPWDDDIDVAMLRCDYEVFLTKGQDYLPDYFFLQSRMSEPELLSNFAKIRDSRTTFIESSQKNLKINHGIYIDVFPLDYFPDNDNEKRKLLNKLRVLNMRVRQEYTLPKTNRRNTIKELFSNILGIVLTLRYPSVSDVLDLRDKLYKGVKPSSYLVNYCGAWGSKEVFPAEWLSDGELSQFEGLTVRIPKAYDKYLNHLYGDYMKLPPEEKRISHHYTDVIDTERTYKKYIN